MRISILGCGWLGLPLGISLAEDGHDINGSTTQSTKVETLEQLGIRGYLLSTQESFNPDLVGEFVENSDAIIITMPPKKEQSSIAFLQKFIKQLDVTTVKTIIYTSSIGIYKDEEILVTEETPIYPITNNAKEIATIESLILSSSIQNRVIFRLGGLIGGNRHPIFHLQGRENIPKPNAVVNLVHLEDVIEVIKMMLSQNISGIYNIVHPNHPTRQSYYQAKAEEYNLEIPQFADDDSKGKLVSSEKIMKALDFSFKYPL